MKILNRISDIQDGVTMTTWAYCQCSLFARGATVCTYILFKYQLISYINKFAIDWHFWLVNLLLNVDVNIWSVFYIKFFLSAVSMFLILMMIVMLYETLSMTFSHPRNVSVQAWWDVCVFVLACVHRWGILKQSHISQFRRDRII